MKKGPEQLRPDPSLVAVSDRAGTLRSVYGEEARANAVVARAAVEGAEVFFDKVVARAAVEGVEVNGDPVVARVAVEGAVVFEDKVIARAAEEDVTLSERIYLITFTEATEHVGAISRLAGEIVVIL